MSIVSGFFADGGLTPHGFCLSWDPDLMALHVVSDALIGLAYFSIPLALVAFLIRRRDIVFRGVFWLFALFILACGSTHFLSIWTLWHPDYATEGLVKAATALVSVLTAIQLWLLLPRAVALPSPEMLRHANAALEARVAERDEVVRALQQETADRLRTEAMLARAQKMDAVGQLTGGIAHDFNNLLMVVMANLELLGKRTADDPQLRKYVDRAMSSVLRGAALIQQLLAFARRQPLQPVGFDPGRLVADMAALLRGLFGKEVTLSIEPHAALWHVEADPHQLESALLNLAINARDAMPSGGTVSIRCENATLDGADLAFGETPPGDFVMISVSDTGIGMPPNVRDNAFEPFFTTKPVGQGSGLGLSQVYGFIKQSQGHVSLQSEPGEGTTVSLYLRRSMTSSPVKNPASTGEARDWSGGPDEAFAVG